MQCGNHETQPKKPTEDMSRKASKEPKDKKKKKKSAGKTPVSPFRRIVRWTVAGVIALFVTLCVCGAWYARHPLEWIEAKSRAMPAVITAPLMYFGDRTLFMTDALGWTGHDAVYDCDDPPPEGQVFYAGRPVRVAAPAPADIRMRDRGPFVVGWSDSLQHPVWVAYHVPPEAKFEQGKRPSFRKDRSVAKSPAASAYNSTGYDRGHLAPNRAIATRFGPEAQAQTFLMSNITPQSPALNRGPWRELEQRIADLWTARWGETWVLCGAISGTNAHSRQTLPGTHVDVPESHWMLIIAQAEDGVRALALILPQTVGYRDFPVHRIVTIDELEKATGLNLLPELPSYLRDPLKADRPTRLWPVRLRDIFKLILIRFV
jgi:endonuclease G